MKPFRLSKKWVLVCIGLLLALFVLKVVLFLTTKPKITVDYMAEYNSMSCPTDYDPNHNAEPYYQNAFDALVDMPAELHKPFVNWPTDFNDTEQALFEKWLISNTLAFEYFKEASNKTYYWIRRRSEEDNCMGGMKSPDLAQLRKLAETLGWQAKLKAAKGEFQTAFEDILDCYKAGKHKCRSNLLLMEQYTGLSMKNTAVKNSLEILDRAEVDSESLKFLQDNLKRELDRDTYIPGPQAEKLYQYDILQRTFIDNSKGTGRLWWRMGFGVVIPLAGEGKIYERKIKMSCFTDPTRKQAAEQIEQTAALFNQVMQKTPWQIKDEGRDYFKEIENINSRYIALEMLHIGINSSSVFHSYHQTKAQTDALIAVLAILRYKADTGRFPESLDELVSAGYLDSPPNDPYSAGPLVYKLTEDKFKLYSVGEDFADDGGVIRVADKTKQEPGFIAVSFVPHGRSFSPDIIYWPVIDLNKLRYEFTFEQAERLGAEKEAEAQKKIEEANQPK